MADVGGLPAAVWAPSQGVGVIGRAAVTSSAVGCLPAVVQVAVVWVTWRTPGGLTYERGRAGADFP